MSEHRSEARSASDLPLDRSPGDASLRATIDLAGDSGADFSNRKVAELAESVLALRARVAELEADNQGSLKAAAYWKENWQRSEAHANALREALEKCEDEWRKLGGPLSAWPSGDGRRGIAIALADECAAALATTPAASLAAVRASVIEECAKWHDAKAVKAKDYALRSEFREWWEDMEETHEECAKELRALAAQEVKP